MVDPKPTIPTAYIPAADGLSTVLLDESLVHEERRISWQALFGRVAPGEVEIGSGKGTFLLHRARARPEVNFLGIEYARAYCEYAADRCRRAGLTNVRMLAADAMHVLRVCLPDFSLWRIHVYFPDPWPKRRHHRRRLVQPPFVREVLRVLHPGGQLLTVTDSFDYFDQIRTVLASVPGLAHIDFPSMADASGELVGTNFERKYIAQGRPFYKLARLRYV
jgi:tRNA (guanine-N7-)-methyltransferase